MHRTAIIAAMLLTAGLCPARAAAPPAQPTPEALKAQIDTLRAPRVAWREVGWKSCLLEGLRESRAKKKPILLWVFIDRPIDDARC
jgi:hypothetical protein